MKYYLPLITLLFIAGTCLAQPDPQVSFDNLGIMEGLSQSTVSDIVQDRLGYMWFCTEDGLNRYDGYHFKTFRNDPNDGQSLPNNRITAIYSDSNYTTWLLTNNGLCAYDPTTEYFQRVIYQPGNFNSRLPVQLIEYNGGLFFTQKGVLYRVEKSSRKVTSMKIPGMSLPYIVGQLKPGVMIVNDKEQLYLYNLATQKQSSFSTGCEMKAIFASITLANDKILLAGDHDMVLYDVKLGKCIKQATFNDFTFDCVPAFDDRGFLWAGTRNGLLCLDTADMKYHVYRHSDDSKGSLAGNIILALYKDRAGVVWAGTNEGGVSKVVYKKFKAEGTDKINTFIKNTGNSIFAFAEDGLGNMWMGTDGNGVNIYNLSSHIIERLDKSTGCNFNTSEDYILSLLLHDDFMFCGHSNGIDIVSVKTRKVVSAALSEISSIIKTIARDGQGRIWAVGRHMVYLFDPQTRKFNKQNLPFALNYVTTFFIDQQQNQWFGMYPGLRKYVPETGKTIDYAAKYPQTIGSNTSTDAFCQDSKGTLYLSGHEKGLLSYAPKDDSFIAFGHKEGMPYTSVYAALTDWLDNVWMSTNLGIITFDAGKKTFTNYLSTDGLQSNEFNGRAAIKDTFGRLWFGGVSGFNIIDPKNILKNKIAPIPQIISFKILEKEIKFRELLARKHEIIFHEKENYFSIEYSAMDYTNPEQNKFQVMMEGFDKSWRPITSIHTANYTNLSGGDYLFKVRAFNNDGIASKEVLSIPIHIIPYFYKTWWFYSLIALLLIAGTITFYRYRIGQLKKELRLRTTIASDLHDDVGATLSSIKMLSSMLLPKLRDSNEDTKGLVMRIGDRAASTLDAMSDIVWSINPKNDALENLVMRMKTFTSSILDDTDIDYAFNIGEGIEKIKFNQQQRKEVYLIFKEALTNAMKYAAANLIYISLTKSNGKFEVVVRDDGKGFDPGKLAASMGGNGLKNMQTRASEIGATVELTSAVGEGTTMILKVPV